MLKKLKRGLKNINKTFNTSEEEQKEKQKRRYKSNNTKSLKTSTNSDKLPNVNDTIQYNYVLGPNSPNKQIIPPNNPNKI